MLLNGFWFFFVLAALGYAEECSDQNIFEKKDLPCISDAPDLLRCRIKTNLAVKPSTEACVHFATRGACKTHPTELQQNCCQTARLLCDGTTPFPSQPPTKLTEPPTTLTEPPTTLTEPPTTLTETQSSTSTSMSGLVKDAELCDALDRLTKLIAPILASSTSSPALGSDAGNGSSSSTDVDDAADFSNVVVEDSNENQPEETSRRTKRSLPSLTKWALKSIVPAKIKKMLPPNMDFVDIQRDVALIFQKAPPKISRCAECVGNSNGRETAFCGRCVEPMVELLVGEFLKKDPDDTTADLDITLPEFAARLLEVVSAMGAEIQDDVNMEPQKLSFSEFWDNLCTALDKSVKDDDLGGLFSQMTVALQLFEKVNNSTIVNELRNQGTSLYSNVLGCGSSPANIRRLDPLRGEGGNKNHNFVSALLQQLVLSKEVACQDNPSALLDDFTAMYGSMDCKMFITALGCDAVTTLLSLKEVITACPVTWRDHCTRVRENVVSVDDHLSHILARIDGAPVCEASSVASEAGRTSSAVQIIPYFGWLSSFWIATS